MGSLYDDALRYRYSLPFQERKPFLRHPEAVALLEGLSDGIGAKIRDSFIKGLRADQVDGWEYVIDFFNEHSLITSEVSADPGTYLMLEKIYTKENVSGVIDNYYWHCLAGQALRNRLEAAISYSAKLMTDRVKEMGKQLILNLGAGPGRDTIEMCLREPSLTRNVFVDCIDLDAGSIAKGQELVSLHNLDNFRFSQVDIHKLKYRAEADYGLLIGILCPFKADICVKILRIIKRYFKPGAQVVSACLLDEQLNKDPLCSYLLKETAGWALDYKSKGLLKTIYEEAGYIWKGSFSDEPTNFYEIGIGVV